ncbi:transposase-like protein [Colletotrichum graminicola]|nr:transposase-like protein [Colletotrichum graminicola]
MGAKRIPNDDPLGPEDWKVLAEIKAILEPFYLQTKRTEGWGKGDAYGRLWEVMTGMEYILEHLEEWKNFYNSVIHPVAPEIDITAVDGSQQSQTRSGRPVRSPEVIQVCPALSRHITED